jgi:glycine betaine/proline transport system substrate-binding protein
MVKKTWIGAFVLAALMLAACGDGGGPATGETDVDLGELTNIELVANTWEGSEVNVAVAKRVLESVGYTAEVVALDENAMWTAMATGDVHAALEVWPSGHAGNVADFIDSGAGVVNLGELGVVGRIGWFVPTYMVEQHPELATWEGFQDPELAGLFATAETGNSGQFLAGDPAFVQFDGEIIRNLGLPLEVVVGGSEEALLAALDAAYSAQEPLLFYFWTPHEAFASYDLTQVELPPYTDECGESAAAEDGGVDCDYPADVLFKIGWAELETQAPAAFQILKNFNYSTDNQIDLMAAAGGSVSVDQAAADWMAANESTWQAWLP